MRAFHERNTTFSHPFFAGFSLEHERAIAELSLLTRFDADELIFREGDPANRLYLINSGKVGLQTHVTSKGLVTVDVLGSGDVLGWSWLYEPYVWHFDARALEETTAWFIYGTRLREECEQDPSLGYAVMQRISQVLLHRLQSTRRRMVEYALRCPEFSGSKIPH